MGYKVESLPCFDPCIIQRRGYSTAQTTTRNLYDHAVSRKIDFIKHEHFLAQCLGDELVNK